MSILEGNHIPKCCRTEVANEINIDWAMYLKLLVSAHNEEKKSRNRRQEQRATLSVCNQCSELWVHPKCVCVLNCRNYKLKSEEKKFKGTYYLYGINIVPLHQCFLVSAPVSSVHSVLFHVPCRQEKKVKTAKISKAKQSNLGTPEEGEILQITPKMMMKSGRVHVDHYVFLPLCVHFTFHLINLF